MTRQCLGIFSCAFAHVWVLVCMCDLYTELSAMTQPKKGRSANEGRNYR